MPRPAGYREKARPGMMLAPVATFDTEEMILLPPRQSVYMSLLNTNGQYYDYSLFTSSQNVFFYVVSGMSCFPRCQYALEYGAPPRLFA